MNVTMLPLGSISPTANTGKSTLKNGDLKNSFSGLLQVQSKQANQNNTTEPEKNVAEILKEILQILKQGITNSKGLEFTNHTTITDDQISNLLGMDKEDWKSQVNDLLESLQSLFANSSSFLSQLKEIQTSLTDGNLLKGMSELASAFSMLPSETIGQLKGNQLQTFAKNVKATEQLAKTVDLSMGDIKQLTQLNNGLQNVMAKIELLLKSNKQSTQNAILQTAFSSILKNGQGLASNTKEQTSAGSEVTGESKNDGPLETSLYSNIMNPMSKTEQFVLHLGKGNETTGSYSEFVKEFTNILAKSQLTTGLDGTNKLFIKLYPEHLGSIRIELLQDKGSITAKMFASSGTAKDLLDSGISQLKDAFSMQNIQVDKIDVLYGETQAQKFGQQDSRQQSSNQNNETPNQENEEENDNNFSNFLSESLLEKVI
ncbi:MAG: flagellar hook-length control protein FliK [Heyndrickxia sp.]